MTKFKEWRALDHCDDNEQSDADVNQDGEQSVISQQESDEWIIIKDSEDIDVITTDRQAAVSLQVGIQAAIAAVISITIADGNRADQIVQDLRQVTNTRQSNRQKTIIEQSKDVEITTIDTDIAINIQLLLQVLVAIVLSLDVL
ncbi:spore coat protein [Virgibacillus ainsalahensis]